MNKVKVLTGCMAALIIVLLSACSSHKDFIYLQDMHEGLSYQADFKHEAVIHCDDRLAISVGSKNPELALPFNSQTSTFRLSTDGNLTTTSAGTEAAVGQGYRVDVDGNISFPILGKLHVEGMTLNQATELIRNQIIEGNYIKEPLVSIDFLNFKYSVLGAVGRAGTYSVDGDRITLLEAIARAGDLTTKARYDRVTVIREQGGERKVYVHDLRSKDIFDSPAFYLQQNDVVYVEPKYNKRDREDRTWQFTTFFVSLASLACSLIWALK